jgi:hypothetical protein
MRIDLSLGIFTGVAIAIIPINPLPVNATYKYQAKCPATFAELASSLTQDLPDYLNRTYSRAGIKRQAVIASFPELEPIKLEALNNQDNQGNQVVEKNRLAAPQQLFLSVLTRDLGKSLTKQVDAPKAQPYWLFIANTHKGWRLAMAFSRVGNFAIQDVSDGAIATATKTWLSDRCP